VLDDPDQTRLSVEMVFAYRRPTPRNEVAIALGLELNELGHIVVNTEQHTNVPVVCRGGRDQPARPPDQRRRPRGQPGGLRRNYFLYRPVQRAPDKEEC